MVTPLINTHELLAYLLNVNLIQPLLLDIAHSSMIQPHLSHCGSEQGRR